MDLINQVNIKSVEISDLNASLQEKALAITALKEELRKLKGKSLVDNNVSNHPSDPKLHQVNVEPITPKLLNNRTAHSAYIKHSQEEAAVLRDLVDHIKANYPLDPLLESACKYTILIQEIKLVKPVLVSTSSGEQLVAVTPMNKVKRVRFTKPVTSSRNTKIAHTSNLASNKPIYDNHDLCVLDFISNVNARAKSRSVKKNSKRKVWKPTGKVFTPKPDISNIDNGTEFVNQTLREYYEKVGISHETSVARSPQQNGVVERRNRTLIEAARTMLIYAKAPLFLWAEAVATACYTQNRSMIRLRHGKTPYELLHNKPPDLSYLHVFGALCYPTNDSENLGKLQPKADIGIFIGYAPTKKAFRIYNRRTRRIIETIHVDFDELTAMASEHSSSGPALHEMTPATISSGLVPNPPPSTPFVPPSRTDWDILFQPLFDELFNPPPSVDFPAPEVIAPIDEVVAPEPAVSTSTPSSTTVDQDAPSPSNSQTTPETPPPVIPNDVEEDNHDIEVAHMGNDPYFGIQIPEVSSDQSSSSDIIHTIVPPDHQVSEHNSKWTKDHPLEIIII
ncbi:retrovirus-related pol polyprotein from transposon TNT 1-94 [Tanacetum coccineum]